MSARLTGRPGLTGRGDAIETSRSSQYTARTEPMSTARLEATLQSLRAEKALMVQRLAAVDEVLEHERRGNERDSRIVPTRFKKTVLQIE